MCQNIRLYVEFVLRHRVEVEVDYAICIAYANIATKTTMFGFNSTSGATVMIIEVDFSGKGTKCIANVN